MKKTLLFTIFSFILIIIGLVILILAFFKPNNLHNLDIQNKSSYEVTYNDNNYFSNNIIPENNYYITSLIKDININYDILINNLKQNNYTYKINIKLQSNYENNPIFEKEYPLKNNNLTNNINEQIVIDYNYYLNYINNFESNLNLKTDSSLLIELNIIDNDTTLNYLNITIPLKEKVIFIEENDNFNKQESNNFNHNYFTISIILITSGIFINLYFNKSNNFKRIIKEYKSLIIKILDNPNINNYEVINITSIEDLIKISLSNDLNILNYNNKYFIIKENIMYLYTK